MQGATQENWLHAVPKSAKNIAPRINLTFRALKS
jgi:alkylated DNA repair dioxygenase AlkB